jgi:hypothetical protein
MPQDKHEYSENTPEGDPQAPIDLLRSAEQAIREATDPVVRQLGHAAVERAMQIMDEPVAMGILHPHPVQQAETLLHEDTQASEVVTGAEAFLDRLNNGDPQIVTAAEQILTDPAQLAAASGPQYVPPVVRKVTPIKPVYGIRGVTLDALSPAEHQQLAVLDVEQPGPSPETPPQEK